jgi:glycine betaine/proline transport system substrate-binding protein
LKKPIVAERITKLIQGIGSGATISVVSKKAVAQYGLEGLGYTLRPGTAAEWIGALNAAMAERRWIIFPTWAPQYLNRENKIRALQDPRGVLGGINHASLVSPCDRFERLPLATRVALSRIELGIDGVTEMDWLVNVAKQTPSEAARQWMAENDKRVAEWLNA